MAGGEAGAQDLLLLYGGTFDPIHRGHLAIAMAARDALRTTVHFMPAADPPHRAPPGADAAQRARMLDLAVAGEPGLAVDRRELQRDGRSYTVDTLRALRAEIGNDLPVGLLLGADSFLALPQWKQWQTLFELTHFVVAGRPGSPMDQDLPAGLAEAVQGRMTASPDDLRMRPAGCVLPLSQPLVPISASDVRARIALGQPWTDRVAPSVAGYIIRHRLYANRGAAS